MIVQQSSWFQVSNVEIKCVFLNSGFVFLFNIQGLFTSTHTLRITYIVWLFKYFEFNDNCFSFPRKTCVVCKIIDVGKL